MKIFSSEYQADYSTYTFGYTTYCIKENQSELPDIYGRGFLPYTGDLRLKEDIFYRARSFRIDLAKFSDSAENRRINRKVAPLDLTLAVFRKEDFDTQSVAFRTFCSNYAKERFVGGAMTDERLDYVLSKGIATHVFVVRQEEAPKGYLIALIEGGILHYWFAFFDTDLMRSHSLGKWMMWAVIDWSKRAGLNYVYLGTAYNTKSLYKIRDFPGGAFFDGMGWNEDMAELKFRCKTDHIQRNIDRFKEQP